MLVNVSEVIAARLWPMPGVRSISFATFFNRFVIWRRMSMKSSAISRFDTSRLRIWLWTSEMCVSSSNASIQIRRTKHDEILSLFRREDRPEFSSRLSDDSSDDDLMNNWFIQCQDEIYKINAENQIDLWGRRRVNLRQFGNTRCTAITSRLGWTIIVCWIRCLSEKDVVTIVVFMFHWMSIIGQMSSAKRQS